MKKYYHLQINDGQIFKGESNKQFTEFGFNIIKGNKNPNNILTISGPLDIKCYKVDHALTINSYYLSTKLSAESDKVYILWFLNYNKEIKEYILHDIDSMVHYFDKLNYNSFYTIRRPIKYAIQKLLYKKISEIDDIISNTQNNITPLVEGLYTSILSVRDFFDKKYNNSLSNNNIEECKKLMNEFKVEIEGVTTKQEKTILDMLKLNKQILQDAYFILQYTQSVYKESFIYEEKNENIYYKLEKVNKDVLYIIAKDTELYYDRHKNIYEYIYKDTEIFKNSDILSVKFKNIMYYYDIGKKWVYFGEINSLSEKEGFGMERFLEGFYENQSLSYYDFYKVYIRRISIMIMGY